MIDKSIYVVAKIFDQQGCIAYRCKTLNEARCLPGTLEALRAEGVQIVILDDPDIYSEYAPYEYIEDMKEFIDKVNMLNKIPAALNASEKRTKTCTAGISCRCNYDMDSKRNGMSFE